MFARQEFLLNRIVTCFLWFLFGSFWFPFDVLLISYQFLLTCCWFPYDFLLIAFCFPFDCLLIPFDFLSNSFGFSRIILDSGISRIWRGGRESNLSRVNCTNVFPEPKRDRTNMAPTCSNVTELENVVSHLKPWRWSTMVTRRGSGEDVVDRWIALVNPSNWLKWSPTVQALSGSSVQKMQNIKTWNYKYNK